MADTQQLSRLVALESTTETQNRVMLVLRLVHVNVLRWAKNSQSNTASHQRGNNVLTHHGVLHCACSVAQYPLADPSHFDNTTNLGVKTPSACVSGQWVRLYLSHGSVYGFRYGGSGRVLNAQVRHTSRYRLREPRANYVFSVSTSKTTS